MSLPIISADSHITEPPDTYVARIDARFRDRAPRLVCDATRGDLMIDRDQLPSLFLTTPDDLTKRRRTTWMLRAALSASQPMHAMGDWAYRTLGQIPPYAA